MMGAGKTTVGRLLADRLGWAHFDSDAQVMADTGRTVPELFAERGEPAFRAEESAVLAEALSADRPVVVSAAGGVVLSPTTGPSGPRRARWSGSRADPATADRRVGHGRRAARCSTTTRRRRWSSSTRSRRPLYESVADGRRRRGRPDPDQVVDRVLADPAGGPAPASRGRAGRRDDVPVELGDRRYEVLVGDGVRDRLAEVLPRPCRGASRAAVVTQDGHRLGGRPRAAVRPFTVPDGEAAKSLATVEQLCRGFARPGLSRADVVVAVGGGVVTDLAGFAAASFHRGVAYVNVATTLLAQVDAAVGGKTGVNLPEGKNLVGAFWQPRAVLCDTEVLATLPPAGVGLGPRRDGQVRLPGPARRTGEAPGRLAARPPARGAGGPVRGHQGRGGGLRRAGG